MSRNIEETEILLRQLSPAQPSDTLREKIREQLHDAENEEGTNSSRKVISWLWLPIAVAACLVVVLGIRSMDSLRNAEPAVAVFDVDKKSVIRSAEMGTIELLSETNSLVAAEQSPVFYLNNGVPAREVYLKYMDTYEYRSGSFSKPIVVTYPREEIRIVPVFSD